MASDNCEKPYRVINIKDLTYMSFVIEDNILKAYEGDDASVIIPDGVETVGDHAFYGKRNMETLTLPHSVPS